jgi:P-type Cu2+ transporter
MPRDLSADPQTVELLVPGMRCGGCVTGIEKRLGAVDGVLAARVNLTAKRARVAIDPARTSADALVGVLADAGWEARRFEPRVHGEGTADRAGRDLLRRIAVAGFASMNVMLLSVSVWSGAEPATRDVLHWISALIALPAAAYAGLPFFRSAASALAHGRMGMDVPISMAILLACVSSVIATAESGQHAYFDAAVMLTFFLLIGRYLEHRTRAGARTAAAELMALSARTAIRVAEDGTRAPVPVDDLCPGTVIEVAAGERLPADGTVIAGRSDLDRALVTGESVPEPVAEGSEVHAGMLNLTGPIRVVVTATGDATLLAEIARLVDAAERARGRYDRLADRAAHIYSPGIHVVALAAFCGWMWATGDWFIGLEIATAVLIITCPCALGLAVPTVHTVATGRLFRQGIYLKDGAELERLAEIDLVAFDKTGTLTDGAPRLVEGPQDGAAWAVAAALAGGSRHPLSRAIAAAAEARGVVAAALSEVREVPGYGVEAVHGGVRVRLGRPEWIGGGEGFAVAVEAGASVAGFRFAETLRPGAVETCERLRALGLDIAILSGDADEAVDAIAAETGIGERHARLRPGEKLAWLDARRAEGCRVLMVGDGLNDGPALAAAHASMSPAGAADVAKAAAGLVFTGARLDPVAEAVLLARTARRRTLQSFAIAAGYNAVALPLAIAGLVTPLIAAAAMSGSSILVVLNALRLRNVR